MFFVVVIGLFIISYFQVVVNNFFIFFFVARLRQLWYLIMSVAFCQQLFCFIFVCFSQASGEGGIWTLAPLLTTCTLSRGVPSASLGTSPYLNCSNHCSLPRPYMILTQKKNSFEFFSHGVKPSGEDGIRTHVPLRTNGFQDRLVMTTSIPLRVCCFRDSSESAQDIYYHPCCFMSTTFFIFLKIILQSADLPAL